MKAIVTGATGFLGANLVRELLHDNIDVTCILRKTNLAIHDLVQTKSIDVLEIPLLDNPRQVTDLAKAMEGADVVFHLAGIFDPSPEGLQRMTNLHIFSTRALLRATEMAKVPRFVHCSSSITVGFGSKNHLGTEDSSLDPMVYGESGPLRHYYNTKKQSENMVLGWEGLDTVVVNPDYILGPWDIKPTSGQLILSMMRGHIPVYPNGGKCFLGAKDCAKAHIAAWQKGKKGQRYLLGYHNHSYQEIMEKIATTIGKRSPPKLAIPHSLTPWMAKIGNVISSAQPDKWAGLNGYVLQSMQEERYRSGEKMYTELGIIPEPIEHSIAEAVRWFRDHNYT